MRSRLSWLVIAELVVLSSACAVEKLSDGLIIRPDGFPAVRIQVLAADSIRIVHRSDPLADSPPSLIRISGPERGEWSYAESGSGVSLSTAELTVRVDAHTGAVSFEDPSGDPFLDELPGSTEVGPAGLNPVRQRWSAAKGESLYGLGQHQQGFLNLAGRSLDLWQHNTEVALPLLVSTRGFGILWDNASFTRFGNLGNPSPVPPANLLDTLGRQGGLERQVWTELDRKEPAAQTRDASLAFKAPDEGQPGAPASLSAITWDGFIKADRPGTYVLRARYTGGLKLWLGEKLTMDHWRQDWLPNYEEYHVNLLPGIPLAFKAEWLPCTKGREIQFSWLPPSSEPESISLWSQCASAVDYTLIRGPSLDKVIRGYRHLTGAAPLMPIWAFGLWQSRQRYRTQDQLQDALEGFRRRSIPLDVIVQDWFYWPELEWGSHRFDPRRYPDPAGMIRRIHDRDHARIMISVWPKFYPGTSHFDEMRAAGALYEPPLKEGMRDWIGHPYTFYDAFNPRGRQIFWNQIRDSLYGQGIDAWWLDAPEPDLLATPELAGTIAHMRPTAADRIERVLNAYPLMNAQAVSEGQLEAAPDRRVFILTRSAFGGQQRYGAATWSGDISSTWTAMAKQIPAGLGFSVSGIPYWTMDVGGFAVPERFAARNPTAPDLREWRELNARWFQFGAFTPLLRVHGEAPFREMWEMGAPDDPAYLSELKFDRLRYRLLPYLYSQAAVVWREGGTFMRPLAMDFPSDRKVLELTDQYLFGPSFMVSPVTRYQARRRPVYLPSGRRWYDFWTGKVLQGGHTVTAEASLDQIPLHIPAGAIIPLGPELQFAQEKPSDPILLMVYAGSDGAFDLYEDDGVSNAYLRGQSATIPIRWNDASQTLTLGARQGSFPGMLRSRTFKVVLIAPDKEVPFTLDMKGDQTLAYSGSEVSVRLGERAASAR